MKSAFSALATLATVASAMVVPDRGIVSQLVLADANRADAAHTPAVARVGAGSVDAWLRDGLDQATSPKDLPVFSPVPGAKASNLTMYQLIAASNYTTNFTALVDRFPDIVQLLNTTSIVPGSNHSLFVPVDAAFATLPGGLLNDSRPAVVERLVRYHLAAGNLGYDVLFATHTVPTLLTESALGGEQQRLRVRFEKKLGVRVNAARVVAANFAAANGVLHAVDTLLVPPPPVAQAVALDPVSYSTLSLAMAQTNFSHTLAGALHTGATVFAPTNTAFAALGADVNAFLFNTPRGAVYLRALLQYAVAADATVYSDAYYGPPVPAAPPVGGVVVRAHYDLPTLLAAGAASVSVNITSVPGYTVMLANDAVVAVQDVVAKDGVIHAVDDVVLPPLPGAAPAPTHPGSGWGGKKKPVPITVAELIARFAPFVDDAEPEGPPARVVAEL